MQDEMRCMTGVNLLPAVSSDISDEAPAGHRQDHFMAWKTSCQANERFGRVSSPLDSRTQSLVPLDEGDIQCDRELQEGSRLGLSCVNHWMSVPERTVFLRVNA